MKITNLLKIKLSKTIILVLIGSSLNVFSETREAVTVEETTSNQDIFTKYSQNLIKVDLSQNKTKIMFSYCDKNQHENKCVLLGKGIYNIEDLEKFKGTQIVKATLNGITTIIGFTGGVSLIVGGAAMVSTGLLLPLGVLQLQWWWHWIY
jgi:hypothetical protein